jgi:tetratricopeptide (TPR) repeat protein
MHLGDRAYERGDFAQAVDYYSAAEERTTDPGLVAFNKAAALYRLGRFREAELEYLRSLEDSSSPRRDELYYNLGNCLVRQSQEKSARMLERAVHAYEKCLSMNPVEWLRENSRHNLELARALWSKAKSSQGEEQSPDSPDSNQERSADSGSREVDPVPSGGGTAQSAGERINPRGTEPGGSDQLSPGAGNLPVLVDTDEIQPLAPEDAGALLAKAAARIERERREHFKQRASKPLPHVPNW